MLAERRLNCQPAHSLHATTQNRDIAAVFLRVLRVWILYVFCVFGANSFYVFGFSAKTRGGFTVAYTVTAWGFACMPGCPPLATQSQ